MAHGTIQQAGIKLTNITDLMSCLELALTLDSSSAVAGTAHACETMTQLNREL
jgi:hypothetical protein